MSRFRMTPNPLSYRLGFCIIFLITSIGILSSYQVSASDSSLEETLTAPFQLKPYRVSFAGKYKMMLRFKGKAERRLEPKDGHWLLTNDVKSRLVKIHETSKFEWLDENVAKPLEYRYKLKAFAVRKSRDHVFDYDHGKIMSDLGKEELEYDMVPGLMDRLSHQTALRAALTRGETEVSFEVAEKRGVKTLDYRVVREEQITTVLGTFDTVVVERVRSEDSKRQSLFWLAKDWDFLLIKALQKEKGKDFELLMINGELAGQPISGLEQPDA